MSNFLPAGTILILHHMQEIITTLIMRIWIIIIRTGKLLRLLALFCWFLIILIPLNSNNANAYSGTRNQSNDNNNSRYVFTKFIIDY
jgi:hypothetical protein